MQIHMAVEMERSLARKQLRSGRERAGTTPHSRSARNLPQVEDQVCIEVKLPRPGLGCDYQSCVFKGSDKWNFEVPPINAPSGGKSSLGIQLQCT